MKSLNRVMIIGNAGKDAALTYTPGGTANAKFSLATSERYKDKSGEWTERTEWIDVVLWARLAEIAGEYVKKGNRVYIEGRIQTSSWEDKKSGEKKFRTEVVGQELILLDGKGERTESGHSSASRTAARQHAQTVDDSDLPF